MHRRFRKLLPLPVYGERDGVRGRVKHAFGEGAPLTPTLSPLGHPATQASRGPRPTGRGSRPSSLLVAVLSLGIVGAVLTADAGALLAQEWPTHPVKVIVPYGPGGISDTLARMTADRLVKAFGQPFVIDNRGGAGGVIGTEAAARSPADGYTLYLAGGAQLTVNPLVKKLPYDPLKDFTPISMVSVNGMALTVHPDLPARSVRELIDYVRANPGKINYASAGLGQSSHLTPAAFAAREGLQMVVVPYQSTPQALVGLLSGSAQVFFGNVSDVLELVHSGKARMLAISTEKRVAQFPDIPTVSETVPGFVMTGWIGYFAPTGTPRPIIDKVSRALVAICREPDLVSTMEKAGVDAVGDTPDAFAAAIQADLPIMRSAVEAAGLLRK
jgi:tripartite-type tricarboxylate transporter receptor subunit TctC